MLTKLFSSQVRVKILKFLVMHPETSFTAGEIASKTGSIIRSVNKEMVKLIETEIVVEEVKEIIVNKKKTKVKHYHSNTNFFIYSEIKDLFLKMQVLDLEEFKEKFKKIGSINYVVLCGRFLGNSNSSIDLLVVGGANHKRLEKIMKDFNKNIGWEMNWTLMSLDEYDYRQQIGDIFLYNILASKKIEVINKFV